MSERESEPRREPEIRSDYDGAWKAGFKEHLREFMSDFFPMLAALVDWSGAPQWQDRELEQLLARLKKRNTAVDLLVKLKMKSGEEQSFLFHIEIQSSKESDFETRLHLYNAGIFFAYGIRVVTMAVLADLNSEWNPNEDHWALGDFQNTMKFPTCKLIDRLDSGWKDKHSLPIELARAQIAALRTASDPSARFRAKMELMKSVYHLGYTADDIRGIYRLIDHMMLLREDLQLQFRGEILEFEERNSMPYITSIERLARDEGLEQGIERGLERGALRITLRLLEKHFGPVPAALREELGKLNVERLEELAEAVMDMGSHDDVAEWLRARS